MTFTPCPNYATWIFFISANVINLPWICCRAIFLVALPDLSESPLLLWLEAPHLNVCTTPSSRFLRVTAIISFSLGRGTLKSHAREIHEFLFQSPKVPRERKAELRPSGKKDKQHTKSTMLHPYLLSLSFFSVSAVSFTLPSTSTFPNDLSLPAPFALRSALTSRFTWRPLVTCWN